MVRWHPVLGAGKLFDTAQELEKFRVICFSSGYDADVSERGNSNRPLEARR